MDDRTEQSFSDACAEYLQDDAMYLRCQVLTGPERDRYVPAAGRDAPLMVLMRCHPLRESLALSNAPNRGNS